MNDEQKKELEEMSDTLELRVAKQIAKCNEKWETLEGKVKETKDDTREILKLLRGEGSDPGLVGLVRSHEERLDSASKILKALWASLVAMGSAIAANYFRR